MTGRRPQTAACRLLVVLAAIVLPGCRRAAPAIEVANRPVLARPPARPYVMYISLASDATFKRVVLAPLDAPDGARYVTPLGCERVYFSGTRGLCMQTEALRPGVATHAAQVFDEQFTIEHTFALTGAPSRTRLSPDGRRAAFTVFDEGHSYAEGVFSTRTTIVDTISGNVVGDLEQYAITRDGQPFKNVDFNFWGVTFAQDGNRFFATLRTRGQAYLIEGNVDRHEARVLMPGAECPSLSRDNTRIVFKKQLGGRRGWWQISLFDLASGSSRILAGETRSVDDQIEWLDDSSLLYFLPTSDGNIVWRLPIDESQAPRPFIQAGFSPAVVR